MKKTASAIAAAPLDGRGPSAFVKNLSTVCTPRPRTIGATARPGF